MSVIKLVEQTLDAQSMLGHDFKDSDMLRPRNEHYVDKLFDAVANLIDELKEGENIIDELVDLTKLLMQGVKEFSGLQGVEKKIIVLKVIRKIVTSLPLPQETTIAIASVVTFVLPKLIDVIIAAADGELDLGRNWRKIKKLKSKLICC